MLGDRTYLLFKPKTNLPNDRLSIKQDYSLPSSTYRSNPLTHSSSYERLSSKSFSTTPLPKRKFLTTSGSSGINNSIYDSNYDYATDYIVPRRRTATFSYNNLYTTSPTYSYDRKPLQRSDSFGSTAIGIFGEKSSNMEKREMLMSSFNRHTNTSSSWKNRLKLSNLFSSTPKKVLPSRPSSNYHYTKSNYTPYKTGPYRVNYLMYDDYYRPRIRDRPLFSEIRKSVMHKTGTSQLKNNNRYYANNYSNNYSNKFNKNSTGAMIGNASVLSNGSSGGLSSSSSGGSISYTQQSTTTTSPSETPAFSSPLQSQKSIRKVDRYRSVIKFREHNIGKTYEERKNTINWDIGNEDPFSNSELLKELVGSSLTEKIDDSSFDNTNNKDIENIWSVITDTTLLTHSSSTTTLSDKFDLNVGYEAATGDDVNKLEQQFADMKRKKEELDKLKIAVENDNLLNIGRRKLHKSVNSAVAKNAIDSSKKSKSVKINTNVMIKDIKTNDLVEQINKADEKVSLMNDDMANVNGQLIEENKREEGKVKKILKTTKSLVKKPSKVKIKEEQNDVNNNEVNNVIKIDDKLNKNDSKFKNKQQSFKTLFVRPEMHTAHCNQGYKKTNYKKPEVYVVYCNQSNRKTNYIKPEVHSSNLTIKPSRTSYFRFELEKVEIKTKLVMTDFYRLETISKLSPLVRTEFERPKTYVAIAKADHLKTDYYSPKLVSTKLTTLATKTHYFKPTIQCVELICDLVKTDYSRPILHKVSTKLGQFKTSYKKPELLVTQLISPPLKTTYKQFELKQIILNIPPLKTAYERLEWFVSKPLQSKLLKTEFQSPTIQIVQAKSDMIMTDFVSLPIQIVVKVQNNLKTDYSRVPIEIVQLNLPTLKTDYHKVPVQEVNLRISCFESLDYQSPLASPTIANQISAKPPLHLSAKNRLSRTASKKAIADHLVKPTSSLKSETSSIQSTLSSIKSVLSLNHESNDLKRNESKESLDETDKKKVKKVKKVKVAKASSISGTKNEKKTPKINQPTNEQLEIKVVENGLTDMNYLQAADKRKLLARSVSLDVHDGQDGKSNTFQNAIASKEQYRLPQRKRIKFRNYNIEDFYLQSVLGRGESFGKVFLAELIGHNIFFAIKCLKKNVVVEDNDVESTMIERKVLALGSSNPFICKLFCTFQTPSYLCFAMEYLAGGDLMFHVQKNGRFDEDRARFYAAEIVCALKFLHRRYIIYRDLKLDNILLDKDGHIRLVDFGMCQLKIYRQECLPSNFCGTPDYMAPEIVKGIKYNHAVDWWSFGVLLYEMVIGKSPFTGADEDELLWNVCNEKIIFPLFLSKEAVHIIALLLNRNPEKRLGMAGCPAGDVSQQLYFRDTNWQLADAKLLPPPFIPELSGPNDIQFFDKEFTEAEPALTPVDDSIINDLNHDLFEGFDYTNPNLTD